MDPSIGSSSRFGQSEVTSGTLPMFEVKKVDMEFDVASDFVAAQVANNVLALAQQTGRILRIDLDSPEDIDDIDLPKKSTEIGTVRRMFMDPTASHLIVSTSLGENYYLHAQSQTPKPLSRLKGVIIDCVSWNPSQPTASTREILIGAADGNVYETFIELSNEMFRREEKFIKNIYKTEAPVCGLWTDQIPGRADLRRVLVATTGRLLHFIGKAGRQGYEGSGSIYSKLFESDSPSIHEVGPSAGVAPSTLAVTPDAPDAPGTENSSPERIFAWRSSQGILQGKLLVSPASPELGNLIFKHCHWHPSSPSTKSKPAGLLVALSQWHILQLVDNRVIAINRLDESIVYDQVVLDKGQRPLALLADLKKNTFWLFTSQGIFEIEVQDEDRDIWRIMMNAQKFDEALQYTNNSGQRDAVATASGDYLLGRERFMEAASVYGKSSKSFEQVSLNFIDKGQRDALRKYLSTKLSVLKKSFVMQRAMLASWLTELFMTKLDALDDMLMTRGELTENKRPEDVESQLSSVRREFQDFIRRYKDDLDRKTVYETISSHGRESELLFYSTIINDHNYVLSYWIQRENWPEALKALSRQTDAEVIYKYSSVLMTHSPVDFVDILMRQDDVDARNLIPACLNYNENTSVQLSQNQAIRYLLFAVNRDTPADAALHNTILSIYASSPTSDESALLGYLESQTPSHIVPSSAPAKRQSSLPYDADFALRLCIKNNRLRSCAHIYTAMGQYVSAVETALQHGNTDIAIAVAELPEHDTATQKRLWITIAKSVICGQTSPELDGAEGTAQQKQPQQPKGLEHKVPRETASQQSATIKTALSLLRRAPPGILRIEDLLPLFPDFVQIDAFKDEICAALESYSAQIEALKREMDDSATTAARIKEDEAELEKRWVLLEPGESCGVCGEVLLDRRFWVWGCGHGVHGDCLTREIVKKGSRAVASRVKDVRAQIESGKEGKRREGLIQELDDLLGRECPLCGDMAIRMVDEPFVTPGEERGAWAL